MKQLEYFAIANPCQHICRFGREQICRVCYRSLAERQSWDSDTDEAKRATLRKSHRRRLLYRREAWLMQQKKRPPSAAQQIELFADSASLTGNATPLPLPPADDEHPQLSLFD